MYAKRCHATLDVCVTPLDGTRLFRIAVDATCISVVMGAMVYPQMTPTITINYNIQRKPGNALTILIVL